MFRAQRSRRLAGAISAVCLLLAGVITVFSIQAIQLEKPEAVVMPTPTPEKPIEPATDRPSKYVTAGANGEILVVDRANGARRMIRQDEKVRLAEGLKRLINNSDEGLVEVHHSDGRVSMDLEGRFQNVVAIRREADGTITHSCMNDLDAAAAFFEIDRALLGLAAGPVSKKQKAEALPIK